MKPLLVYFADPMCSWCWGFSPVIARIRETYGETFETSLVLGGLAPGTAEPLDDYRRQEIRKHWVHVAGLTGQPFDHAFFERERFVYDTEPACHGVVAVRTMAPGREFDYLAALHEAFYARNVDITDVAALREIAESLDLDTDEFTRVFDDPKTRLATGNDFAITQSAGVRGFPTLAVGEERRGMAGRHGRLPAVRRDCARYRRVADGPGRQSVISEYCRGRPERAPSGDAAGC